MVGSLLSGVNHWLGNWCSVAAGLTGDHGSLLGFKDDSPTGLVSWLPSEHTDRPAELYWEPVRWVGLQPTVLPLVCLDCPQHRLCLGLSPALAAGQPVTSLAAPVRIDPGHVLHPFSVIRFDAGPVRLASIVHAFNYRMAVLRDGSKLAKSVADSQKAECGFLAVSWTMCLCCGDNRWW